MDHIKIGNFDGPDHCIGVMGLAIPSQSMEHMPMCPNLYENETDLWQEACS